MQAENPSLARGPQLNERCKLGVFNLHECRPITYERRLYCIPQRWMAVRLYPLLERRGAVIVRIVDARHEMHSAQTIESGEATAIMKRSFVADQNSVEVMPQMRYQSGNSACTAVAWRIHSERRHDEESRTCRDAGHFERP